MQGCTASPTQHTHPVSPSRGLRRSAAVDPCMLGAGLTDYCWFCLHCRWADLPKIGADTAARAAKLRTPLTGDAAHQYSVEDPSGQQQPADDDTAEASKNVVTEVQRLRYMIDSINAATAVLPKVSRSAQGWLLKVQEIPALCSASSACLFSSSTCACTFPAQACSHDAQPCTSQRMCWHSCSASTVGTGRGFKLS